MKVIDNLSDIRLYIEKAYCMKFKYTKDYYRDKEYNLEDAKEDDLIICVYDDVTCKLIFTRLMKNKKGRYIDALGYRYYFKDSDIHLLEEE